MDNVRVHVLDDRLRPVGIGLPGEIYVAGTGLARGCHGAPAMTAERFLPDPFSAEPGGRLYRTGDPGRWTRDGTLEFLGRADRQLKIRGYRVEPGKVETALRALPGIRDAAVGPAPVAGMVWLVAWYVPDGAAAPAREELRDRLAGGLPDYMLPDLFVPLAAIPATATGKPDRKALPVPEGASTCYLAPRNACETALAGIWADVLGVHRVGVEDDFFEIGGQSLVATRITARILDTFGVDVPLRALFEQRTVAALARVVEERVAAEVDSLSEEEFLATLSQGEGEGEGDG